MQKEQIEKYKTELNEEKARIEIEIKEDQTPPDFGNNDVDAFDEKTDEATAFNDQLVMAEDLKKRLSEIELALEKIRLGTYGICEKCQKEIEEEVLDIDPESRYCKSCKISLS